MNDQRVVPRRSQVDRPFMTVTEVAEYLDVHRITIYRLVKTDVQLGQFRVGRIWRFGRDDVLRFAGGAPAEH